MLVILGWIIAFLVAVLTTFIVIKVLRKKNNEKMKHSDQFVDDEIDNLSIQIVYVYGSECAHCERFTPKFQEVMPMFTKLRPNTNVIADKVEASDASVELMEYVTGYPTVLAFVNGVYYKQLNGDQDKNAIMDFLLSLPTPTKSES